MALTGIGTDFSFLVLGEAHLMQFEEASLHFNLELLGTFRSNVIVAEILKATE